MLTFIFLSEFTELMMENDADELFEAITLILVVLYSIFLSEFYQLFFQFQ